LDHDLIMGSWYLVNTGENIDNSVCKITRETLLKVKKNAHVYHWDTHKWLIFLGLNKKIWLFDYIWFVNG
jgi:hypothetical protein